MRDFNFGSHGLNLIYLKLIDINGNVSYFTQVLYLRQNEQSDINYPSESYDLQDS